MAVPVLMPRQGQSVESCILGQWYKEVGEEVSEGDILFSYETDKASFEEEAKENGILLATFYEEGDEIPVLANVAVIGSEGESIEEFKPGASAGSAVEEMGTSPTEVEEAPKVVEFEIDEDASERRFRISPLARKMAESLGVNIQALKGSGPHGRIIARDIEKASKTAEKVATSAATSVQKTAPIVKPAPTPIIESGEDFEVKAIPNIRKLIATAMHQSLQNSAQLTHHLSADARQVMKLRKQFKQQLADGEIKQNITINDLVCFAVIRALEKFPQVNTHYHGDIMK